jgi:hypothetical protein
MPLTSHSILVGLDTAEGDVRYVRRFVGAVLTADTYLGDDVGGVGVEYVLSNPAGPVMGRVPMDVSTALLRQGDGARFGARIAQLSASASQFAGGHFMAVRTRGTLQVPSPVIANDWMGIFSAYAYDGVAVRSCAELVFLAEENIGAASVGTRAALRIGRTGSGSVESVTTWRIPSAGIGEQSSGPSTCRIVGGSTLTGFRNAGNTAYLDQWTDVGVRRIIGPIAIGSVAADPVASALVEYVSTTQGVLYPRMTQVQRDAIAAPASGLVIYNTTTGKLNLRGAVAWEAITSV